MTGAVPRSPPKSTRSPTLLPGAGMTRTAVVFWLATPMAASSAMMAEMVSAVVSPGTAGRHDAALFHSVVKKRQRRGGAVSTAGFEPHLFQDIRHTVPNGGGGGEGKVDYAEGHIKPAGGLLSHELTHAGYAKGGLFYSLCHHVEGFALHILEVVVHNAGAGHAHVDDTFALTYAVEGAGHEGVVLHSVCEHHELGAADGAVGDGGGLLDDLTHELYGVHVDAGAGGGDVHAGADVLGGGESLGQGGDELTLPVCEALLHQGGHAADEVHARRLGGVVQRNGEGDVIVCVTAFRHEGEGSRKCAYL